MQIRYYASDIQLAVTRTAEKLSGRFVDDKVVFVVVMDGAFVFAADLLRQIILKKREIQVQFVKVCSYHDIKQGKVQIVFNGLTADIVRGSKVVIIDDICETGQTLETLRRECCKLGAVEVLSCTLLTRHQGTVDFFGFHAREKDFFVGYGLDLDGKYRDLPDIYSVGADVIPAQHKSETRIGQKGPNDETTVDCGSPFN